MTLGAPRSSLGSIGSQLGSLYAEGWTEADGGQSSRASYPAWQAAVIVSCGVVLLCVLSW